MCVRGMGVGGGGWGTGVAFLNEELADFLTSALVTGERKHRWEENPFLWIVHC